MWCKIAVSNCNRSMCDVYVIIYFFFFGYAISLKRSCMDSCVAEIRRMLWQSQYVGLSAVIFGNKVK